MSDLIIDACALINIENSEVGSNIFSYLPQKFFIQGLARFEASSMNRMIDSLLRSGDLTEVDASLILSSAVQTVAERHGVGIGEAECIVIAKKFGMGVLTDDKKGKRAAVKEGVAFSVGTIGLLCECVDLAIMTVVEAKSNLDAMRSAGGHLPVFDFQKRQFA